MPNNNGIQNLILSLVILIMINLSIATLGGLVELQALVYFWYLALLGILALAALTLTLGIAWTLKRVTRSFHNQTANWKSTTPPIG
jgi:hypothetical protein